MNDYMNNPPPGIEVVRNKNKFVAVRIHYTAVPAFSSEEWVKAAKDGYLTKDQWEQEMEINFTLAGTNKMYPMFDHNKHVRKLAPIKELPIYIGWDFGFHHPAVVVAQIDTFDCINILDEDLGSDITIQKYGKKIKQWLNDNYGYWMKNKKVYHFGDPAGNQQNDKSEFTSIQILKKMGFFVRYKRYSIKHGVRILQQLMMGIEDKPMLKVDPKCKTIIDGFSGGYIEISPHNEKASSELPFDDDYYSHCFIAETKVLTHNGEIPISEIKAGDYVTTPHGNRKVLKSWLTRKNATVIKLILSNGKTVTCTPDHKIFHKKGIDQADALWYNDVLITPQSKEEELWKKENENMMYKNLTESGSITNQRDTTRPTTVSMEDCTCIGMFMNPITVRYQKDIVSTTLMGISQIIELKILKFIQYLNTHLSIASRIIKSIQRKLGKELLQLGRLLKYGMVRKLVENGTQIMRRNSGKIKEQQSLNVECAVNPTNHISRHGQNGVRVIAKQQLLEKKDVYDITVEHEHVFYANGILVHNCQDALRYLVVNKYPASGGVLRKRRTFHPFDETNPLSDDELSNDRQSGTTGYRPL